MTASGLVQLEQLEHAFHWKFSPCRILSVYFVQREAPSLHLIDPVHNDEGLRIHLQDARSGP